MPECERCGETHATVNEAEWVDQSINLCPSCWDSIKTGREMRSKSEIEEQLSHIERDYTGDSMSLGTRIDTLRWVLDG